jgi:hypothetical protein
MVDQLNAFAGEVTRVAREVGTEGRLGAATSRVSPVHGRPHRPVNSMAGNLTLKSETRRSDDRLARGDLS